VLTSIALGAMLVPLNSTMIAVALPDIMHAFGADVRTAGWLVTAYLVTMAALQLVAGQLGDRFGRRRFVLGGLVYFVLASLLAAQSPSLSVLLFARVQQGIAGSVLITNGMALAFEVVPGNRRGSSLGAVSAVIALAAAAGPPVGGLLVSLAGWRGMFWANIPVAIAALLLGWSAIAHTQRPQATNPVGWREILSIFRSRSFACANGAILFSNLAMYALLLAVPILMSAQAGRSALQAGLMLGALSVTMAALSPIGGRLSDHVGRRLPSVAGVALLSLGVLPLALWGGAVSQRVLLACLALAGVGLGLSSVSLQTSALETVKIGQAGIATGVASTSRYLGSIIGSRLIAQLVGSAPGEVASFRAVFVMVAISAGLALLMSWAIHNKAKS
jgi:MFS family permease